MLHCLSAAATALRFFNEGDSDRQKLDTEDSLNEPITIENKYLKVLVVTQRAKQIRNNARPLVELPNARATRVALEEVDQGLIAFEFIPTLTAD